MKKYFIVIALTMFTIQSCNDDFLDRYAKTEITKESFFNNEQDLETYITSLYDFPGFNTYINDHSTDNAATTGSTEVKNMMIGNPTSSNITSGWDWEQLRRVNFFLENFEKAAIDQSVKDHYEGLARFFRAKFYMDKVKRYSDVPWYNKVLTNTDPDMFKARDPRTLIVDSIFSDYQFAREHVQEDSRTGVVNKWVVLAYMARHALHEGTYRKYHAELALQSTANTYLEIAAEVAKEIMEDGSFSIHTTGNAETDYADLFNNENLSNIDEVILATYSENGLRNSGWWGYMFGNYEANPARDLLQTYLMQDGTPYTNQAGYETKQFTEEFVNRDLRLQQTYAYPGWELINTDTYAQGGGIYVQQLTKNFSGYHQLKGFINDTDVTVQANIDVPVLRYAEILLIYAEARAELGILTQADLNETVNVLRNRADMPSLSMGASLDPVLETQYPLVSGANKNALLEIRRERRVELALEGFRFDDLMRWNAGKLIEKEPEGLYFPGLGKYDLTGDGHEDIILISNTLSIPGEDDKEVNALGKKLIYYRVGPAGSDASFYLSNGTSGTAVTDPDRGSFLEPKFYYRPVPQPQVTLNPNLEQIFGW